MDKDPVAAEKALLKLPGLKRYKSSLRSKTEQENFLRHLRKYIFMYMTDCPWEVSTTNRYTITTYEAAVTARRRIKQGETIKHLVGTLVPLTTEESADLDLTNRNFSIVVSSRKKNSSIFLGPARFANHDCDANGRLVTKGNDGMEVIAMKNIEIGDEITVSYGDDYFGPGNVDCLCYTCEALERNGWTSSEVLAESSSEMSTPMPEEQATASGLSRKRKLDAEASSPPSAKRAKALISPSKLQQSWTPPSSTGTELLQDDVDVSDPAAAGLRVRTSEEDELALSPPQSPAHSTDSTARKMAIEESAVSSFRELPNESSTSPSDNTNARRLSTSKKPKPPQRLDKMTARLLGKASTTRSFPLSPASTTPSSHEPLEQQQEALAGPNSSDTITVKIESTATSKVESDDAIVHGMVLPSVPESIDTLPMADEAPTGPAEGFDDLKPQGASVISTLTTTTVTRTVEQAIDHASERGVVPSIESISTTATTTKVTIHPISESIRVPGDYVLTRKLLAQPHDRWVQCHNEKCLGFFIQPNGYQTRRECPRCERHSILYGFEWPKTDPDARKLLERTKKPGGRGKKPSSEEYSAYRRRGRCGKGTWVEGGGDDEERTMDHRTIHRFVLPEEEKELTRKGLLREAELARQRNRDRLAFVVGRGSNGTDTESLVRDTSESGSATPDEFRRKSSRFVPNRVYANVDLRR